MIGAVKPCFVQPRWHLNVHQEINWLRVVVHQLFFWAFTNTSAPWIREPQADKGKEHNLKGALTAAGQHGFRKIFGVAQCQTLQCMRLSVISFTLPSLHFPSLLSQWRLQAIVLSVHFRSVWRMWCLSWSKCMTHCKMFQCVLKCQNVTQKCSLMQQKYTHAARWKCPMANYVSPIFVYFTVAYKCKHGSLTQFWVGSGLVVYLTCHKGFIFFPVPCTLQLFLTDAFLWCLSSESWHAYWQPHTGTHAADIHASFTQWHCVSNNIFQEVGWQTHISKQHIFCS